MDKRQIYGDKLRQVAGILGGGWGVGRAGFLRYRQAVDEAAEVIAAASDAGYLDIPHLAELVRWGRGNGEYPAGLPPKPPTYAACMMNVFFELVGGWVN